MNSHGFFEWSGVVALGIGAAAGVGDGEVARGTLTAALVTKIAFRKAVK